MMRMGYSNTRSMRICMQTIYEKKLKSMRRPPKSRKQREVYSVVLCCVTIRPVILFEPMKGKVDNERVP